MSPVEAEAFRTAVDHFLEYTEFEAYLIHDQFGVDPSAPDPADNDILPGNLGTCILVSNGKILSNCLIAPSSSIQNSIRDGYQTHLENGKSLRSRIVIPFRHEKAPETHYLSKNSIWVLVADNPHNSTAELFHGKWPAKPHWRHSDSEWLLLHVCDGILESRPQEFDTVVLVSDRIPCPSCTEVIINFLQEHPTVRLSIGQLYDSGKPLTKSARGACHFTDDIGKSPVANRVTLTKLILSVDRTLNIIPYPI